VSLLVSSVCSFIFMVLVILKVVSWCTSFIMGMAGKGRSRRSGMGDIS